MPQKEGCENQISDDREGREEWWFGYRGVSNLVRSSGPALSNPVVGPFFAAVKGGGFQGFEPPSVG
jgi:hypothetical protein